jgi:hypothetical protein
LPCSPDTTLAHQFGGLSAQNPPRDAALTVKTNPYHDVILANAGAKTFGVMVIAGSKVSSMHPLRPGIRRDEEIV